jgi:hypothetical protein
MQPGGHSLAEQGPIFARNKKSDTSRQCTGRSGSKLHADVFAPPLPPRNNAAFALREQTTAADGHRRPARCLLIANLP